MNLSALTNGLLPWPAMGGVALLLHMAGLVLALHALLRPRSPQGSVAWMLALLLMPALSIPFYLTLGAVQLRAERRPPATEEEEVSVFCPPAPRSISACLYAASGMPPCEGNSVQLLRDGNETYRALQQAIESARHSILLEFFIIRHDRVGDALRRLLEERARAGVQVCVIYDEIGSIKLPLGYLRSLRQAGVKVASFNGRRYWWSSFLRINYRNHRKLVIIDGAHAYLGSLNVGLEYLHRSHHTYWRDSFASLRGPVLQQCLLSFRRDWRRATGETLHLPYRSNGHSGNSNCQLLPSAPSNSPVNIWQCCVLELAAQAKKRFWLTTPYLVPTEAVSAALQNAALRGVDVRILVPKKGDKRLADLAMLSYLPELLASGVRIYAYRPGVLHEKLSVMDDEYCSIGTANLDARSLRLNFELSLLIRDRGMAEEMAQLIESDRQQCGQLSSAAWYRAKLGKRLAASLCRLISPML